MLKTSEPGLNLALSNGTIDSFSNGLEQFSLYDSFPIGKKSENKEGLL